MPYVEHITAEHDLNTLAEQINAAVWDEANEMSRYEPSALANYLAVPHTIFIACYEDDSRATFLGMASSRMEFKPYDNERWIYVDEVDVAADQRKRGAGKAMMQWLIDHAEAEGCLEVWLGTEVDNEPAKALYHALDPDEAETFVGFTWELD